MKQLSRGEIGTFATATAVVVGLGALAISIESSTPSQNFNAVMVCKSNERPDVIRQSTAPDTVELTFSCAGEKTKPRMPGIFQLISPDDSIPLVYGMEDDRYYDVNILARTSGAAEADIERIDNTLIITDATKVSVGNPRQFKPSAA